MYRTLAKPLVKYFTLKRYNPIYITYISIIPAVLAYIFIVQGYMILGILLLQVSIILDCCDGAVAKATGQIHKLGGYIDNIIDRVINIIVYLALAQATGLWLLCYLVCSITELSHYQWDSLPQKKSYCVNSPIKSYSFLNYGRFSEHYTLLAGVLINRIELALIAIITLTSIYTMARLVYILRRN